ncbi:MAG: prenyltransferase [Pseudomonadota bacterium]
MNALTAASPFHRRFLAWLDERFPFANALLFFILYLTTAALVRAATGLPLFDGFVGGTVDFSPVDVLACAVTWSYFLLLRIFDEHKDYALDLQNHPQRVLQSGLITLAHLRVAGALAIALQLGFSLWRDAGVGGATVAWLAVFAWTCLMGKEFFVGEWLNKHLTWYAVSHMLVMPLIVWWLANLALPGTGMTPILAGLMTLAFVSGFCFEITRKTKGPEEERDSIESYSRIFGTRGSAFVVMGLVTAMVVNQLWLVQAVAGAPVWWAALLLVAALLLALRQLWQFVQAPDAKGRGKNEAMVAIAMLAGYAVLIAVAMSSRGTLFHLG